jgi:hypothetical protein
LVSVIPLKIEQPIEDNESRARSNVGELIVKQPRLTDSSYSFTYGKTSNNVRAEFNWQSDRHNKVNDGDGIKIDVPPEIQIIQLIKSLKMPTSTWGLTS